MTIRHYKIFLAVADRGTMSAAAASLYISQPTVSQAVAELERHYGALLFERLSQRLYITELGRRLLPRARKAVEAFENAEAEMLEAGARQEIRIGCSVSVGTVLINDILDAAEPKMPGCRVSVTVDNTAAIEKSVLENQSDIGIIEGVCESGEMVLTPVITDYLVLICAKTHRLAGVKNLTFSDLEGERLISREKGSYERNQFEKLAAQRGIAFDRGWSCTNTEAIKNAVICGRGIAVMSSMLIKRELAAGEVCMLDLEGMPMRRALNLIYHKDKFITPAIANIIDVCKRYRAAVGERSAVSPPEEGGCV